nr:MAG TPA: hypothetical protein [Caudoviricetes sp.]
MAARKEAIKGKPKIPNAIKVKIASGMPISASINSIGFSLVSIYC